MIYRFPYEPSETLRDPLTQNAPIQKEPVVSNPINNKEYNAEVAEASQLPISPSKHIKSMVS